MHHQFQVGETVYPVWLSRRGSVYLLHFGDAEIPVALRENVSGLVLETDGDTDRVVIATHGDEIWVHVDGAAYALRYRDPLDSVSHHGSSDTDDCVRAPMPGIAVMIEVKAGQKVVRGDALLVMESMKLETTIAAPREGIVQAVHVALGQPFERDAPLVTLEAEEAPA